MSWKTASPGLAAAFGSLEPPLPFRAALLAGRGNDYTETKSDVKHNPQLFSLFFAKSLQTRMASRFARASFFTSLESGRCGEVLEAGSNHHRADGFGRASHHAGTAADAARGFHVRGIQLAGINGTVAACVPTGAAANAERAVHHGA